MGASKKGLATDGFGRSSENRYGVAHNQLDAFLEAPERSKLAAESGKFEKADQLNLLCAAMERAQFQKENKGVWPPLSELIQKLSGRKLPFGEAELIWNLNCAAKILAKFEDLSSPIPGVVPALLDHAEELGKEKRLSPELLEALRGLHGSLKPLEFWAGHKKSVQRLEALIEQKKAGVPDDGEAWAEAIRNDIKEMSPARRKHWLALLENAPKGTSAKPTAKWKKEADELLAAVGPEEFAKQIEHWFALIGVKATAKIQPRNAGMLRSLVWYASTLTGETVCRALANAVEGGLRKLAAGGLYASSISKACIAALEEMPGMGPLAQFSRLKHRVKSP